MTLQVRAPLPPLRTLKRARDRAQERSLGGGVWWFAGLAALLRIPYLRAPMSPDEGGFLIVAQHWHAGGGSMYGQYWVDRPPLLIDFFGLADLLGGFTALRLLGCAVVALTVLGVGLAAAGSADDVPTARRASTWAALVTAGLLVTPTGGAVMVNGELIAGMFIAFGIALTIRAVRGTAGRVSPNTAAVLAGCCAAAAVMVKQNMIDVAVFAVVLGLAAGARGRAPWRALSRRALLAASGGVATLVVILGAAFVRGTTPGSVFYAMYPFRFEASKAMQAQPSADRMSHLTHMLHMWAATGAPLVIATFVAVALLRGPGRGRLTTPLVVATLVLLAYDGVSIWAGGAYWSHYMVQLVVPIGLMAGLLLGSVPRLGRVVVVLAVAASLAGYGLGFTARVTAAGVAVGAAVKDAAMPGDTVVSVLGDGVLVKTSGLASPYRYLWSLPAHVLDHRFRRLTTLLDSSHRPTWVVVRGSKPTHQLVRLGPGRALQANYDSVAHLCGREVYLRKGLTRDVPATTDPCWAPLVTWNSHRAHRHWLVTEGPTTWHSNHRAR